MKKRTKAKHKSAIQAGQRKAKIDYRKRERIERCQSIGKTFESAQSENREQKKRL